MPHLPGLATGRRHAAAVCLGLLLAALLLAPAQAAQRVALLIGNAGYSSAPLTNPPQDVDVLARALRSVGFEVRTVLNADQRGMKRAVAEFGDMAQGAELALFYYSGHGAQAQGENYLIPLRASIAKEADYELEAVSANTVLRQIMGARPRAAIVVLDACRDNPLAAATKSGSKGLARMDAPSGSMIAFATAPNTTASDEGHYARALARQIQTRGLELYDVFRNTTAEVSRLSQGRQVPRISEVSITERIYLAGEAAVQPPPTQVATVVPEAVRPAQAPAPVAQEAPRVGQVLKDCDVCPELVVMPTGSFMMGSPVREAGRESDETLHRVTLGRRYAMGKYEVTQGQWRAVMGSNPSGFKDCGDDCPVESVSWNDAQDYVRKLNERTGNRYGFRLPSEAEWEYAARAGTQTPYAWGGQVGQGKANCDGCGSRWDLKSTAPVGQFAANAWGLYDMAGNVREWVQDCYGPYDQAPTDGSAREGGNCSQRVLRGGSWYSDPPWLRPAFRNRNSPVIRFNFSGFRVARTF